MSLNQVFMKKIYNNHFKVELLKKYPGYFNILAHWAYEQWHLSSGIGFNIIELDYKRRIDSNELPLSWVALQKGYPVGMVSLKKHDLMARDDLSPWLSALYVMSEFRKQGIGESLIEALKKEAKKRKYKKIYLFVDHSNESYLIRYYTLLGWKLLSKELDTNGNKVQIMYLDL